MAVKLYPPLIEGTIPAFCAQETDSDVTLSVPFSLNRAVAKSEIKGFALKIKTVQNSVLLGYPIFQTDPGKWDLDVNLSVTFDMSSVVQYLKIGQFYKIQIAFLSYNDSLKSYEPGYYSTVGVVKYTSKPSISIEGLNENINNHKYTYVGKYVQDEGMGDSTEKLYSSRFKLLNNTGQVLVDSGEIIHNILNDVSAYEAIEMYEIPRDLDANVSYYLVFQIKTSNNLVLETRKYRIMQQESVNPEIKAHLKATNNFEEGYIDLNLIGDRDVDGNESLAIGSFIVSRAASNENYVWNKIMSFSLQSQSPTRFLWRDYTIEQGVSYKYSIQQYNDYGLYSERIVSNTVVADYEDMFLYDGSVQLKIRLNPQVNTFKTDVLETKTDTIGSKYPYIFRNGTVYYKEFPISGLISYQMDENYQFIENDESINLLGRTYDLVTNNIQAERLFKLKVLNWLNNGKPKLFKSPTEGNYIVRLLNNSLTAMAGVGRMLHSFSCTAYEIADFTYTNMQNLGFVSIQDLTHTQIRWSTVELVSHDSTLDELLGIVPSLFTVGVTPVFDMKSYQRLVNAVPELENYFSTLNKTSYNLRQPNQTLVKQMLDVKGKLTYLTGVINTRPVKSIKVMDMLPGTIINLITLDGNKETVEQIQIGRTGSYYAEFDVPVDRVEVPAAQTMSDLVSSTQPDGYIPNGIQGSITYSYESSALNVFDTVRSVQILDIPVQQFIGKQYGSKYNPNTGISTITNNLVEILNNSKTNIVKFFELHFELRPIEKIFIVNNNSNNPFIKMAEDFWLPQGSFYENRIRMVFVDEPQLTNYYKGKYYYISETKTDEETYNILEHFQKPSDFEQLTGNCYQAVFIDQYYKDMDCTEVFNLEEADPYYIYAICNSRGDYSYYNLPNEQYYVDSMFNYGVYVDANGNQTPVFTGKMLDGNQTDNIFDSSEYNTKITINKDTIDLDGIYKYALKDLGNEKITKIEFDNAIICEACYQVRELTYDIEFTNKTVDGKKKAYNEIIEKYNAFKSLISLEQDYQTRISKITNQDQLNREQQNYLRQLKTYETIINNNSRYLIGKEGTIQEIGKVESQYEQEIKQYYNDFIKELDIALLMYEGEQKL